ncbi:MAG: amidohydrolase family protein [Clostridia bacterium]|nr:amidohydrolase family protein [Clostridia bacterium]
MKADKIIKNAKIFTSDKDKPMASALAVKDGKFVYVGDEAGLSAYEGEVTDLGGKFVMPGIIDSHVLVTIGVGVDYIDPGVLVPCAGKQAILDFMADSVRKNPDLKCHHFSLEQKLLEGARIVKEDLDAICPDAELLIVEAEGHSVWTNSRLLARHGITDETPDPVPGLSYYVRKDGHVTGNIFEGAAEVPIMLDGSMELSDAQVDAALQRWIDFSVEHGVNAVFDAGIPGFNAFNERIYQHLREMDRQGKLPVYVDGCYVISSAREVEEGLKELKRMNREYNTEHLKVHTLKIFIDGTLKLHTAAMVEPYADIPEKGITALNKEEFADLLKKLNEAGLDLHLHTVGDAASRVVLDGVELARRELGDSFRVKVTCAHLWVQDDADMDRFAKLGVVANFTPAWHSGNIGGNPYELWDSLMGEKRASNMYRCRTLWDTGALVAWSSDDISYDDFKTWNPYLGMEVGMTRWTTEKTMAPDYNRTVSAFVPLNEVMSIEEMILGYTINGAKQLGIEAEKGSITAGKDADFLVFDNDLLTAEHEGFSYNSPKDVYFRGKKVK